MPILDEPITVILLDTETQQKHEVIQGYHEAFEYLWTEGNFGCDCNRGIFCKVYSICDDDPRCGSTRFKIVECIKVPELVEIK